MDDKLLEARIKALLLAAKTMAFVIIAITCAMIVGLFVSNEIIDNKDVFGLVIRHDFGCRRCSWLLRHSDGHEGRIGPTTTRRP